MILWSLRYTIFHIMYNAYTMEDSDISNVYEGVNLFCIFKYDTQLSKTATWI